MRKILSVVIAIFTVISCFTIFAGATNKAGDVDGNGIVEVADARLCLRQAIKLENYAAGSDEYVACDVDNDSNVTVGDARYILRTAIGLEKADAGNECVHQWNSGVITKNATCTAAGIKTYTCTKCKATKTESVAALGHNYSAATCTAASKCTRCGATTGAALGHQWNSGVVTTAAKCTTAGVKTYTCNRCKTTKTESIAALGHSYSAATCTAASKCTRCGATTGAALGHQWNSGVVTKEATSTATGIKTYTCTRCKATKTETIPVIQDVVPSTVYKTPTGKCYHYSASCAGKNAIATTISAAKAAGLTPCSKCCK